MIEQLNKKYRDAVKQGQKCLSLEESLALHKIPNDMETITLLSQVTKYSKGIEYPDNFFTCENLFNTNYHDVGFRDFEKYLYLSELSSGNKKSGKVALKSILDDSIPVELPIMVRGKNKIYWQLSGNLQMMAFRVLGIFPIVREISINANIIP